MSEPTVWPGAFDELVGVRPEEKTASTYGLDLWDSNNPTGGLAFPVWAERASLKARMPLMRRHLMVFLEQHAVVLRGLAPIDAEHLGRLIGTAELDGLRPLGSMIVSPSPPRADWLRAVLVGVAKVWSRGLPLIVTAVAERAETSAAPLVPALSRCLEDGGDTAVREAAFSALTLLAGRGNLDAFRIIERRALASSGQGASERFVAAVCDCGAAAIRSLGGERDVQDAVDVAVAVVEVCAKASRFEMLDHVLRALNPSALPVEVTLAFLASTRGIANLLPEREKLFERFEIAVRERKRPDAVSLLRFAQ